MDPPLHRGGSHAFSFTSALGLVVVVVAEVVAEVVASPVVVDSRLP